MGVPPFLETPKSRSSSGLGEPTAAAMPKLQPRGLPHHLYRLKTSWREECILFGEISSKTLHFYVIVGICGNTVVIGLIWFHGKTVFFPHHRFNCNVPSINQNNPIKSGWNSALIGIDLDWTKIIQIYCVLYLHVPTMGRVNQAKWCV